MTQGEEVVGKQMAPEPFISAADAGGLAVPLPNGHDEVTSGLYLFMLPS